MAKKRKCFPLARKYFSVKIDPPNFNHGIQQRKKSSEQKHAVSTSQNEEFVEKYVFTRCKSYFRWQ